MRVESAMYLLRASVDKPGSLIIMSHQIAWLSPIWGASLEVPRIRGDLTDLTWISRIRIIVLIAAVLALTGTRLHAEVTDRHETAARTAFDRLVSQIDQPEGWDIWPPRLVIVDRNEVQALAYPAATDEGIVPTVEVYTGLIERVADFDPDVLAFVIGHELGHLVYSHSQLSVERAKVYGGVKISTAIMAAGRDQELEADFFGMQLALKAGFSHQGIQQALKGMAKAQADNYYCSFEGLKTTHPSWDIRAKFLQKDEVQRELWRSMIAFRNGVLFLETENYVHAEFCFRKVVEEFPDCYEGWANLGYALLMQYADALDEENLRGFDIGHLAVGGFYRRPDSLSARVRGINENLWFEAVGAFRESLRIKDRLGIDDDLLLVKANLAVAYLIHPAGKRVGESEQYFSEVLELIEHPRNQDKLDPIVKASILVNAAAGRPLEESRAKGIREKLQQIVRQEPDSAQEIETLTAALGYSQAMHLSASQAKQEQSSAHALLERYLATISPASSWWPIAYEEYGRICEMVGKTPKAPEEFNRLGVSDWRTVTNIRLPDGLIVGLSQSADDLFPKLGDADMVIPIIAGTNLKTRRYKDLGISILGSHEVLAIFLTSPTAPQITLSRPGVGGEKQQLSVGMTRRDLELLLGDEWHVEYTSIDDVDKIYHLYRDVGLAARFEKGHVAELVIVSVPRKN